MNRDLLKPIGIAAAVLAVFIAIVLYFNLGSRPVLEGSIQNVRVQGMDEKSAVAVIDFRFANPSDLRFIVRDVAVLMEDSQGNRHEGTMVSEGEVDRLFEYFPLLRPKYNPVLKMRDSVPSGESMDRMVCARFETPASTLETRQGLTIRVEDVDGLVSEVAEEREDGSR